MSIWVYALQRAFPPHTAIVEARRRLAAVVGEPNILEQQESKTAGGEPAFYFRVSDEGAAAIRQAPGDWVEQAAAPPGFSESSRTPAPPPAWKKFLPLILGLIALLILLLLLRNCGKHDHDYSTPASPPVVMQSGAPAATSTPAVGVEKVTLPGGAELNLAPNTLNYQLQAFLASADPAPRRFTFDKLNFATNAATLDADAQSTVNDLAAILKAYPKARAQLEGYTDERGTPADNQVLSEQRAKAVLQSLTAQGVPASRLTAKGFGETNPDASNATAQGRHENRRTELLVTSK